MNLVISNKRKLTLCGLTAMTALSPLANMTPIFAEQLETETVEKDDTKKTEDTKTQEDTKKDKETTETETEKETTSVEQKISTLAQAQPNYVINADETQAENVKKMIVDIANKTNIQEGESVEVKQAEKKTEDATALSPVEALKRQTESVQKTIEAEKTETVAEEIIDLGTTEYKKFNTETKKDETKTQQNFLYNNYLVSLQDYDKEKVDDNQTVHVEYQKLSSIDKQALKITSESESIEDSVLQTTVDTIVAKASDTQKGATDVVVRNKDVTAPDIQMSAVSTNIEQGDSFDINNFITQVTDNGQDLDYSVDGTVNNSQPGSYVLTVRATDIDGNTSQQNFTVNVLDDYWQRIADAAIAQIGRTQDCTMLVTNSLAAVGINFHGWPYEYMQLGQVTNNPVPGDIIVYEGHVAIYIGNGRAIHGGWYGTQTVESSVNCGNAFIAYIHPNRV